MLLDIILVLKNPFHIDIFGSVSYATEHMPHQWHSGNAQNWKMGGAMFKPRSHLST